MNEVSDIEMEDGLAAIEALDLDAILDGIPLDSIAEAIVEEITAEPSVAPVTIKAKREKKATEPKAPKLKMKLEDLPDETFLMTDFDNEGGFGSVSNREVKRVVLENRPTAIKVAEKFDNLFFSIHANKKPSTFIVDCYVAIKNDPANMKDLVAKLQTEGYSEGTARSQAQQCYALFKLLEVATETDKQLTRNPTSRIAHFLDNYCEQP